jgi:hypothetical protein
MRKDWFPVDWAELRDWLENFAAVLTARATALGLPAAPVAAVQGLVASLIYAITAYLNSKQATDGLLDDLKSKLAEAEPAIRELVKAIKASPTRAATDEADFKIKPTGTARPDKETYKCEAKVRIVGGEIRIDWTKRGVTAVNVYSRLRGQPGWGDKIGSDTNSPYIDGRPLAQAGVPETREYMLRGTIKDEEIGVDSDVISITWGGN